MRFLSNTSTLLKVNGELISHNEPSKILDIKMFNGRKYKILGSSNWKMVSNQKFLEIILIEKGQN
jgi:hypothetical protein